MGWLEGVGKKSKLPEPGDDHARDDGETREVVAVCGAGRDGEGSVELWREENQHGCRKGREKRLTSAP